MKKTASTFVVFWLLFATLGAAQSTPSASNPDRRSAPSSTQSQATEGGSPESPLPGRVTGATPTQVQGALDRQLPASAQVSASVADDGSLKLTGTVRSEADKAKAEQIAKENSNKRVNNQIQVKSSPVVDQNPKK